MPTVAGQPWEIQQSLNVLAYGAYPPATGGVRDAQQAANGYAGTTNMDMQAALNCKYRSVTTIQALSAFQIYDSQQVSNLLAGTTGKDMQDALSNLAGGPHS
jgi:hypothetical protein